MAYGIYGLREEFFGPDEANNDDHLGNRMNIWHCIFIFVFAFLISTMGTLFWFGVLFDESYLMSLGIYDGGNCKYSFEENRCLFNDWGSEMNPFEMIRFQIRNNAYIKLDIGNNQLHYWSPVMGKTVTFISSCDEPMSSCSHAMEIDIHIIKQLGGNCDGCLVEGVNTSDNWVSINYIKTSVLMKVDNMFLKGPDGKFNINDKLFKRETVIYAPYIILSGLVWMGYMLLF